MPGERSGFGGKLIRTNPSLGVVPSAIPDDEDESPASAPESPAEPEPAPPARKPSSGSRRRQRGAPETVRLRTATSDAFWQSFLAAKQADPFLSVTDHASDLMEAGLDRERRSRAQRER